jgi:hypothetical protein
VPDYGRRPPILYEPMPRRSLGELSSWKTLVEIVVEIVVIALTETGHGHRTMKGI